MSKLPDKLSDLILVSIEDMEACRAKGIKIDMNTYTTTCSVCQAGAVMINSLGAELGQFTLPSTYTEHTQNKLRALDEVRSGYIMNALRYLDEDSDELHYRLRFDFTDEGETRWDNHLRFCSEIDIHSAAYANEEENDYINILLDLVGLLKSYNL